MTHIFAKQLPEIAINLRPNARARRITLRRSARGEGFTVSYPKQLPLREVQAFVDAHEGWIKAHHEPSQSLGFGDEIPYRGQRLLITTSDKRGVRFAADRLEVKSANPSRSIATALKTQAQAFANPRVDHYAERVGSYANEIRWRDPKTRWGSCDNKGNIMLSWRLIMTPDWVFDYVIAHECAHLVHMDHSPKFWKLVKDIYPEFEAAKRYLKREGGRIQRITFE